KRKAQATPTRSVSQGEGLATQITRRFPVHENEPSTIHLKGEGFSPLFFVKNQLVRLRGLYLQSA
ncbi:hypothetical protein, partial [Chamaesiphon sp.]|uniref:hypothetical protein n=1 Tax=Chamaesiphon sp. TaxID=2814140 RepID=UPI003594426F